MPDQDVIYRLQVDASGGISEAKHFDETLDATGAHVDSLQEGANEFLEKVLEMLGQAAPAFQQFHTDIERVVQSFAQAAQTAGALGQATNEIKPPQGLFGKLEAEIQSLKVAQKEAFTLEEARGYQQKIQAAENELAHLQHQLTETGHQGESAFGHLKEQVGELGHKFKEGLSEGAGMGVAILGLNNLGGALEESFDRFEKAEKADRGLEIAFEDMGNKAGETVESLKDYAKERQKVTEFEADATLQVLQYGKTIAGVNDPAKLKQFATAVQNYAAATGKSMQEASQRIASVIEGGGKLRELKTVDFNIGDKAGNVDKFIAATEKKFSGFAEKIAQGPTGAIAQFKNDFGDVLTNVGAIFANVIGPIVPGLKLVAQGMSEFVGLFAAAPGPMRAVIAALLLIVGGMAAYNVISNLSVISKTKELVTEGLLNTARTLGLVTMNAENEVTGAGVVITGTMNVAKGLLNGTLIKTAGLWILEKTQLAISTAASFAHQAATGALLVAKNLLNGSLIRSAAVWVIETAVKVASTVATVAMTVATSALALAMTVLTSPVTLVIAGIALLVAGIIYAYKHSAVFRSVLDAVWGAIKKVGEFILNLLLAPFRALVGLVKLAYEKLTFFRVTVDAVSNAVSSAWGWLKKFVGASDDAADASEHVATAADEAAEAQARLREATEQSIASYKSQQETTKNQIGYLVDQAAVTEENIRQQQNYIKTATDPALIAQAKENIATDKEHLAGLKDSSTWQAKLLKQQELSASIQKDNLTFFEDLIPRAQRVAADTLAQLETSLRSANAQHRVSAIAQQLLIDKQIEGLRGVVGALRSQAAPRSQALQNQSQAFQLERQIQELEEKRLANLKAIRDKYFEITEGIDNAVLSIFKLLADSTGNRKTILSVLQDEIDASEVKIQHMVEGFSKEPNTAGVLTAIDEIVDATGKIRPDVKIEDALLRVRDVSKSINTEVFDTFVKKQQDLNKDFVDPRKVLDSIQAVLNARKQLHDTEADFANQDFAIAQKQAGFFEQMASDRLAALSNEGLSAEQISQQSIETINRLYQEALKAAGDNSQLQFSLVSIYQKLIGKVLDTDFKTATDRALDHMKNLADKIQSVIGSGFGAAWSIINDSLFGPWKDEIAKTKNAFAAMAESMAEEITKLAEEIVAKAAIFAILTSLFPAGAVAQGGLLNFIGFADGGRVSQPTFAIIGEKWQPELILPELKVDQILEKKITNAQDRSPSISKRDMADAFGTALRENPAESRTSGYDLETLRRRNNAKYSSRL